MAVIQSIAQRALIACANTSDPNFKELTKAFASAGLRALPASKSQFADVGLIDLRSRALNARERQKVIAALRRNSPSISILFLVSPTMAASSRSELRQQGEFVITEDQLAHVVTRIKEIIRLRNFVEETGERLKTLATLGRLVEFPTIETRDDPKKILIVGSPSPLTIAAFNKVRSVAEHAYFVLSAGQVLRALERDHFDCIVVLPLATSAPTYSALRAIQRHPQYAHIVVIYIGDAIDEICDFTRKGAREFLLSDQIDQDLAPRINLAIRRARLTKSMRTFLSTCTGENIRDKASGAFTARFLTEHGARIFERADQTRCPLSLIYIVLQNEADASAPSRKALQSATRLINRVIRAEDIAARVAPGKYVILTPATRRGDALAIAKRVKGIVANSAFHKSGSTTPETLTARTSAVERLSGQSVEEVLAAAIKTLGAGTTKTPRQQSPQ